MQRNKMKNFISPISLHLFWMTNHSITASYTRHWGLSRVLRITCAVWTHKRQESTTCWCRRNAFCSSFWRYSTIHALVAGFTKCSVWFSEVRGIHDGWEMEEIHHWGSELLQAGGKRQIMRTERKHFEYKLEFWKFSKLCAEEGEVELFSTFGLLNQQR